VGGGVAAEGVDVGLPRDDRLGVGRQGDGFEVAVGLVQLGQIVGAPECGREFALLDV
jgi:hypothetical protein